VTSNTEFSGIVPDVLTEDQAATDLEAIDEADACEIRAVEPAAVESAANIDNRTIIADARIACLDGLANVVIAPRRAGNDISEAIACSTAGKDKHGILMDEARAPLEISLLHKGKIAPGDVDGCGAPSLQI